MLAVYRSILKVVIFIRKVLRRSLTSAFLLLNEDKMSVGVVDMYVCGQEKFYTYV